MNDESSNNGLTDPYPADGPEAEYEVQVPMLLHLDVKDPFDQHRGRSRTRWSAHGGTDSRQSHRRFLRSRKAFRYCFWLLKLVAGFASGVIFTLILMPFAPVPIIEDHYDGAFRNFESSNDISPYHADFPKEYMRSVLPIPCHSHNDYLRQRPLWSALGSGCIAVEADVWHIGNDLYVGHTQDEVFRARTLTSVYIDPLTELLDYQNERRQEWDEMKGVFVQDPKQTVVLLVDLKNADSWSLLVQQIQPLRERGYLTYWNGRDRIVRPVTVVASGSTLFEMVVENSTHRDVFFDAPLEALRDCDSDTGCEGANGVSRIRPYKYDSSNSYYASSSLYHAIGTEPGVSLTKPQIELIQQQIRDARERGLIPRYWGTPRWPRGLRDEIWSVLLHEGVGVLNVDDLRSARKGQWGTWGTH